MTTESCNFGLLLTDVQELLDKIPLNAKDSELRKKLRQARADYAGGSSHTWEFLPTGERMPVPDSCIPTDFEDGGRLVVSEVGQPDENRFPRCITIGKKNADGEEDGEVDYIQINGIMHARDFIYNESSKMEASDPRWVLSRRLVERLDNLLSVSQKAVRVLPQDWESRPKSLAQAVLKDTVQKLDSSILADPFMPAPVSAEMVFFWDCVNSYAAACGGDTGGRTSGIHRMNAVVEATDALRRVVSYAVQKVLSHPDTALPVSVVVGGTIKLYAKTINDATEARKILAEDRELMRKSYENDLRNLALSHANEINELNAQILRLHGGGEHAVAPVKKELERVTQGLRDAEAKLQRAEQSERESRAEVKALHQRLFDLGIVLR